MTQWEGLAQKLSMLPGEKFAEEKLAIDRNFQPADWKQAWSRGIADLIVKNKTKAATFDYKTGKRKPTEQLSLYAAYIFAKYAEVEQV
jgi:RecB family exonuclease